ncbi:MAG: tRNA uracil 4-sulfurtransferase ThiI [Fibrobacterota bacterium]
MKYDGLILRFGELFLKGKNRHRFINQLCRTVKKKLRTCTEAAVIKEKDHLRVDLNGTDPEAVIDRLQEVFGLQTFLLFTRCDTDMAAIKETTLAAVNALPRDGRTIKVRAKRSWKKFPLTSPEIAHAVGLYVAERSDVPVDLETPMQEVRVVVRSEGSYVVTRRIPGRGGLPVGISGSTMLMLSGGIDSPVAAYYMMKRGLAVESIHFESPPYTSPRARQKVFDLAAQTARFMPDERMLLHLISFTTLQKAIFAAVPESYAMTIMRRMMYRITAGLAKNRDAPLISNGESLGQVASQTPRSIQVIEEAIHYPVVRPLACRDKTEIMDRARKIDTYEIAIRPYEDCCTVFLPTAPATAPTLKKCRDYESRFDWQPLVQECIDGAGVLTIEAGKPPLVDDDTRDEICALL